MRYLLDTCTVSDYFKRLPRVVGSMHAVAPHDLAVTAITEHEVRYGLALQPRATTLRDKVERFLRVVQVLPFDANDAAASAELRAKLDGAGNSIGLFDALIAGVAIARRLTLVTSNEDEFRRVRGLVVANWR